MKILWKGRSLGSSKIKNIVICILTIVTVLLQPLDLVFLY